MPLKKGMKRDEKTCFCLQNKVLVMCQRCAFFLVEKLRNFLSAVVQKKGWGKVNISRVLLLFYVPSCLFSVGLFTSLKKDLISLQLSIPPSIHFFKARVKLSKMCGISVLLQVLLIAFILEKWSLKVKVQGCHGSGRSR